MLECLYYGITEPDGVSHMLYTQPELLRQVRQRSHLEILERTFKDWREAGFLPPPSKPLDNAPKGRGRPAYHYPESAIEVLVWLGTHRRFINGENLVKFWLWVEGFDYIQIEPATVVLARIETLWQQTQQHAMPSLPPIDFVAKHGLTEDQIADLLTEMDRHVTEPMLQTGEWDNQTAPQSEMIAAHLGLLSTELSIGVSAPERMGSDTFHMDAFLGQDLPAEVRADLERLHLQLLPMNQLTHLYRSLMAGEVNFGQLRATWHALKSEAFSELWQELAPIVVPFLTSGPLKSHADLLRLWRYNPIAWVMFVNILATPLAALGLGSTRQEVPD